MTQWAKPLHQREDGKPKKPKKELGKVYDAAQMALPIVASVVATPLAGAAVSALMQGAETKLEGGSWKDAAIGGAMSGGIGAATGGLASALGGAGGAAANAATEGATAVGKGAVTEGAKGLLTEGAKKGGAFGLDLAFDQAGNIVKDTAIQRGLASVGDDVVKQSMQSIASGMGSPGGESIGKIFAGSGKQEQFINDLGDLATGGLGMYSEMRQEAEGKRRVSEALNSNLMKQVEGAMAGEFTAPESKFYNKKKKGYSPYGGYNG